MIIEHIRTLLILVVVTGCSGNDATPDAMPDAPLALDCLTYCTHIEANCTADNDQYPDGDYCIEACRSFPTENSTVKDTSGHTLGCRIHHASIEAKNDPGSHCAHAGPAGDHLMEGQTAFCSGEKVCTTFCTLQFEACGSRDKPLEGNPTDETGNRVFQYRDMMDCMTVCEGFNKGPPYRLTSVGNSLACRLLHATRAVLNLDSAKAECRFTGMVPQGPCDGIP